MLNQLEVEPRVTVGIVDATKQNDISKNSGAAQLL